MVLSARLPRSAALALVLAAASASAEAASPRVASPGRTPVEAASAAEGAPSTRIYTAVLATGIGLYAGSQGRLTVKLVLTPYGSQVGPGGISAERYRAQLVLRALSCPRPAPHMRCRRLSGTLSGQAVDERRTPEAADLPRRIELTALSGTVKGLGPTKAQGEMAGTGFIRNGRRRLGLKLTTARGKLLVVGSGPPVPAFTAP